MRPPHSGPDPTHRGESTPKRHPVRRWVRFGFLAWAVLSTLWVVTPYCTRGVPSSLLASDARVTVRSTREFLEFLPVERTGGAGLVFIAGGGVAAEAYVPLLRPIALEGYPVFIVRLPFRLAPLDAHKQAAVDRALGILESRQEAGRWVIAGHSLGGALASRVAAANPANMAALVLVGTSHPKTIDLSASRLRITKVYASNDGVATVEMICSTGHLLPAHTRWVEIEGGNHSQFGHYGRQLFDGSPEITRERQQGLTREALLEALREVEGA